MLLLEDDEALTLNNDENGEEDKREYRKGLVPDFCKE